MLKPPEPGLIPIRLFPNQGLGFGRGRTREGIGFGAGRPSGYNRSVNMFTVGGEVMSPWFDFTLRSFWSDLVAAWAFSPSYLKAWKYTDGVPTVLFAIDRTPLQFKDRTLGTEIPATANVYAGADFHDAGDGVAYLYAGTFAAAAPSAPQLLNRRTQAAVWTQDLDVVAKYLVSAAGALWRTTSDYQISKCPSGSNPFTLASWGASLQVGTNEARIVAFGALGAAPITFKEDGIWAFNESSTRFENKYPVPIDASNFPTMTPDGRGGIWSPLANGDLVHISQYGQIETISMTDGLLVGRDTPTGPIEDVAMDGDTVYALMQPAYRLVQPSGLKVVKATGTMTVFTDYSSESIDGSSVTAADISALPTATGDLLIGFDEQILAVAFSLLPTQVNTTATYRPTARISTGAGTWATVGIEDGTQFSDPTHPTSMGQSGTIAIKLSADLSGWVKATYNGQSKYWLRLSWEANLSATVKMWETRVVVKRPAPQFSVVGNPTAYNLAAFEASGMLGKVIRGSLQTSGYVWDDIITLQSVMPAALSPIRTPGSNKILVCAIGTAGDSRRSIVVISRDQAVQYPLPYNGTPAHTPYPSLDIQGPTLFYPSDADLSDLGRCHLRYVEITGSDLTEGADYWGFSWHWPRMAWEPGVTQKTTNPIFAADDAKGGLLLSACVALFDSLATDPIGPTGREVIAWVEPADERPSADTEETRTSPEGD